MSHYSKKDFEAAYKRMAKIEIVANKEAMDIIFEETMVVKLRQRLLWKQEFLEGLFWKVVYSGKLKIQHEYIKRIPKAMGLSTQHVHCYGSCMQLVLIQDTLSPTLFESGDKAGETQLIIYFLNCKYISTA